MEREEESYHHKFHDFPLRNVTCYFFIMNEVTARAKNLGINNNRAAPRRWFFLSPVAACTRSRHGHIVCSARDKEKNIALLADFEFWDHPARILVIYDYGFDILIFRAGMRNEVEINDVPSGVYFITALTMLRRERGWINYYARMKKEFLLALSVSGF